MKEKEHFYFRDGINRKKSPLLLGETESYTLQGYSFEEDGVLEPRPTRTSQYTITTLAYQQGIDRYEDNVYAFMDHVCHGQASNLSTWLADDLANNFFNHIYRRGTTGTPSYAKIGISRGSDRGKAVGYKKFAFYQDDEDLFVFDDQYKFLWKIANPTRAPVLSDSGSLQGPGAGTYSYCYTYYIQFPNGESVETGPSPSASITMVNENHIRVDNLVPSDYNSVDQISQLEISIRIYRTTDNGSIYYQESVCYPTDYWDMDPIDIISPACCDEFYGIPNRLQDRNTTNYSYWVSSAIDSLLITWPELTTTSYDEVPAALKDIEFYLQKIFAIKEDKLYWSEDYLPFNWKSASNYITVSRDGEDLVAVCAWGDKLWMASALRWYCLTGTSDDNWVIKQTWTDHGVINRNTVKRTEYGILGQHYDGIRLFNGYNSKNITENILGKEFFDAIGTESACYAEWDGRRYYFYYPTSGATLSGCIVLDFTRYPEIRCFQDDFIATGHIYYPNEGIRYFGYGDGEYQEQDETESISSTWQTREADFGSPDERKYLQQLHYDINGTVSIAIYADGSLAQTISVAETSRKRDMVRLGRIEGYRFYMIITCSDTSNLAIYAPLTLTATLAGTP